MIKKINKFKSKVFYIHPSEVKYCIFPTKFCDYNQFDLNRLHPHAGVNRGVFDENPMETLNLIQKIGIKDQV